MLEPIEVERNELGYHLDEVREGRYLRVVHRPCPESSSCVFFVHGGGGRAGQFKHQIRGLEKKVNVVALDFLGHGDSPSPNQPDLYTADQHLQDLSFIYNKYKCEHNTLVGHCYGGVHSLRLIKQLDDQGRIGEISNLIILCLGDRCIPGTVFSVLPAPLLEVLRPLARSSSNAVLFTSASDPQLVAFENGISDRNKMYMMKVILQDCTNQELWDSYLSAVAPVLVSRNVPCVLIRGEGDGVFAKEKVLGLKGVLEIRDKNFHVIKNAGHLPMLEKPDQVLHIIESMVLKDH